MGWETEEQEFNVAGKGMLRVWALAEGHSDPGLRSAGVEAGSAGPGRQVCSPGGSGAGNHTCHGGLWYHLNAQSQGQHPGNGPVGGQPTSPLPAHSPVGFSHEVGLGAGPSEAGPEEGHQEL